MKVVITAREAMNRGVWDEFCEMAGLSVYAMNEGMDPEQEFILTEEQARELGLLKRD